MPVWSLALTMSLAIAAGAVALAPAADAHSRRGPNLGYVTAESRYGPQTITGPVRLSAQGRREVGLPGGTWIECGRSCSETLRRETVDFWNLRDKNPGGYTDDVGYLRFRF